MRPTIAAIVVVGLVRRDRLGAVRCQSRRRSESEPFGLYPKPELGVIRANVLAPGQNAMNALVLLLRHGFRLAAIAVVIRRPLLVGSVHAWIGALSAHSRRRPLLVRFANGRCEDGRHVDVG